MGLKKFCAVLVLAYVFHAVEGAAILALFSSLSYSDHLVYRGYLSLLAQRGHNIVVMTPYPGHFQYPDVENITELDVGQVSAPYWEEYKKLMTNTDDNYPRLKALNELLVKLAIAQLKSKQMMALLINPNIKFDLVITEADMPLLYAVAEKYKAPHISITTSSGKIHQYESKGNPVHPILYPDVNSLNYGNLGCWGKIVEIYRHIQTRNEYYNNYLPLCELSAKKLLGLKRSLLDVEYDIDLLFVASNPALIGVRPTVPAVVYVDRMHIKPGQTSLPEDLQALLDSSPKGVVYFSVGAIQQAEQLSTSILQAFADAFKELPFTVLWKIGNTTMINKPENVISENWFPQQQVLAHPNVIAFITNGGARSLEEAVFYEVPIIGLPLVKSRRVFIEEITRFGTGEILDPYNLNKEIVKSVINAVTLDKYKKAMSILKTAVYDPIISGPDHAVWWTEYLLRHGEALHLHCPAVGATFFQYYMLDIFCYLLLVVSVAFCLSYVTIRSISRRLRSRFWGRRATEASGKFKAL